MRTRLSFSLEGRDWWKQFLGYYLASVALSLVMRTIGRMPSSVPLLVSLVSVVLTTIVQAAFTILLLRILLPKVAVGGSAFAFGGDAGRYIGLNLGGVLLTIVTLGIYLPWYLRNVWSYLCSETTVGGASPSFEGQPNRMLKYIFLGLWLPIGLIVVVSVLVGIAFAFSRGYDLGAQGTTVMVSVMTAAIVVLALLFFIPFLYLTYKWLVDLKWKDLAIRWRTSFWPACRFLLGQVLLTVITVGIYGPAAMVRIYGYFANAVFVTRSEADYGRMVFEGDTGEGFGLIWVQLLLCLVTAGIYLPWATAKIARWFFEATSVEHGEVSAA